MLSPIDTQYLTVGRVTLLSVASFDIAGGHGPFSVAATASSDPSIVAVGDLSAGGSGQARHRSLSLRLQAGALAAGASTTITLAVTDACGVQTTQDFAVETLGTMTRVADQCVVD